MFRLVQRGAVELPDGEALFEAHLEAAAEVVPQLTQRALESQRAPSTRRTWRARKRDYPWAPLKKTGALYDSLRVETHGSELVVTADVPYSGFHQDTAPRTVLPARRFFPVGDAMPLAWQRAIEASPAVQRAWRGVAVEVPEVYGP